MATPIQQQIREKVFGAVAQINAKNPYYMLGLFLAVLFLADYLLLMQFQLRVLYVLNPKVGILGKELRTTKDDIAKRAEYQQELQRLSEKVKAMNTKIRTREEMTLIIDNVSRLARANGVRIEQIMPDSESSEPILKNTGGQYFIIPLRVEARAGYHSFGKFLNQIEREEAFLTLGDFSIQGNPTDSTKHKINVNIKAIVFESRDNQL